MNPSPPDLNDLLRHPDRAGEVPLESIPVLLAQLAAAQGALSAAQGVLTARLLSSNNCPRTSCKSTVSADEGEQLLTVADAAGRLAFKPAYLYELIRQHRFPALRQGKHIRVRSADLQDWIMQHRNRTIDMH